MEKLQREATTPRFVPDYMAKSLRDVDFKLLKQQGVRYIAFDADSTLVPFREKALSAETKEFLQKQRKLFDRWCIASNRITNDLLPLAESMDAQVIRATLLVRKPQRRFFERVLQHFGGKPHEIAMIGDKLIADMYGGKKAGLTTVWVERIGRDSWWDRHIFHTRRWERRLMRRYIA
ncbi:MAG TPA: HAD-IA family hydrolase [Niastella sp.]|nr:HAD-IA family hydrolase [Niastella sp.]